MLFRSVVAFRCSGLENMIENGRTGWLAEPFKPDSLAAALRRVLERAPEQEWRSSCRDEFERLYAWPGPAQRYLALYRKMLGRNVSP